MKIKVGALLCGAALLSLFVPKRRGVLRSAPQPRPEAAPQRMYALVQVRPQIVVLALSPKLEELEREVAELNETWNRWDLRVERRAFQIQAAPVLVPTQTVAAKPREEASPRR